MSNPTVRVAVLKAPGTNCDVETVYAFEQAGAQVDGVWIGELKDDKHRLDPYQILAIPGGFTYGDDLGAGRILANELVHQFQDLLGPFLKQEKLVIGICNGFQVLVQSGILPTGKLGKSQQVTLTGNDSGKFEDRWVSLKTEFNVCIWTQGIEETIQMPVAHAEGKFLPRDDSVLEQLLGYGQIVFHYCDSQGAEAGYPWNPNGSAGNIAGICDPTGRILGLMPHPERHLVSTQHPTWTRGRKSEIGDGLRIFQNGVDWAAKKL